MAWLDDRVWCHPKLSNVSHGARWIWVAAICYSTGFQTRGGLTAGQLRTIGCAPTVRRELILAGLWVDEGNGDIQVNDWDEHNSKRDERRAADRERKKRGRSAGKSADSPQDIQRKSAVTARVEGSEGSEGSDIKALGLSLVQDLP